MPHRLTALLSATSSLFAIAVSVAAPQAVAGNPVVLAPWVSCTDRWCRNETDDTYRMDVIFDCGHGKQQIARAYLPPHLTTAVGGNCGSHKERCSYDRERWCSTDNPILGMRYENVVVDNGPIPPWPFNSSGSSH
ncbi:hypothetical protein ACFVUS_07110 [Nocardia sp. NPDC058058]|uniref:hypothetical protein n=1 Tax=Nocardia sp. NPDC058058 TaxID=3346317 RepID=UPI0036DBC882